MPSRHRCGGAYEWLNWGTPIAVSPEPFVPVGEKKKRDGPRNDEGARRYTLEEVRGMLEVIPADDRGDWLNFGIILGASSIEVMKPGKSMKHGRESGLVQRRGATIRRCMRPFM